MLIDKVEYIIEEVKNICIIAYTSYIFLSLEQTGQHGFSQSALLGWAWTALSAFKKL